MNTGVYTITCLIDGKIYIGSTSQSFNIRWASHLFHLKCNKHHNKHLQRSFNKYGESNFVFEILEECNIEYCLSQEQYWMNMLNVCDHNYGYNTCPIAGSSRGRKLSQIHIDRIQIGRKGFKQSDKSIVKIKLARSLQQNCGQISVIKLSLNEEFIEEYSSIVEASKKNNNVGTSNICKCIKGIYKSCAGFKWKYKDVNKARKTKK